MTISTHAPRKDPVAAAVAAVAAWAVGLPGRLIHTYRLGLTAPVAAPALFALVAVPEFAQHIVEIRLGMFASHDGFVAHGHDAVRMVFGVAKIAGLVLCMLLTARFRWHGGSLRRALRVPAGDAGRVLLGILLLVLVGIPGTWAGASTAPLLVRAPIGLASILLQFLVIGFLVGALLGDRPGGLKAIAAKSARVAPDVALLTMAAFYPGMQLHAWLHRAAIGRPAAEVWALMAADALTVGVLASLIGSALYVAYAAAGRREVPARPGD